MKDRVHLYSFLYGYEQAAACSRVPAVVSGVGGGPRHPLELYTEEGIQSKTVLFDICRWCGEGASKQKDSQVIQLLLKWHCLYVTSNPQTSSLYTTMAST